MTSSATRPPWLYEEQNLEDCIEKHNPSLNISELRRNRNNCQLVNNVLDKIVSEQNIRPGEWEMNLARIHLAVDLQNILQRWCGIGLQKTLEGSALRDLFSSGVASGFRKPDLEARTNVAKMEATSPPSLFSVPGYNIPHPRFQDEAEPWLLRHYPYTDPKCTSAITRTDSSSSVRSRPLKRALEDADQYQEATKLAKIDKSPFLCPYYTRDQRTHVECSQKTFPNPRKLKEHVWRFIKPFKCPNCGEGFGREKTRAIHCDQRKTKCTKAQSNYEGSPEYIRDQQIGTAKSTQEMVQIFEKYDIEKGNSQRSGSLPTTASNSSEYHAEDRSSSPESQNGSAGGSLGNVSDDELDSGADVYIETSSGSCPVSSNAGNDYAQQCPTNPVDTPTVIGFTGEGLSPQILERYNKSRRLSLSHSIPGWEQPVGVEPNQFNGFNRTQSAPPFPSTSSEDFSQPHSIEVPEIVITEPPNMNINSSTHAQHTDYQDFGYCYQGPPGADGREHPYPGASMEGGTGSCDSFTAEVRPHAPRVGVLGERPSDDPHAATVFSGGWGGFGPFVIRLRT